MDMYEWRKKEEKRQLTDGTGMDTQGHGHADGRVGVWTQMHCVWMRISRKEKEKKKNLLLLMRMVDMLACRCVACGRGCVACGCR